MARADPSVPSCGWHRARNCGSRLTSEPVRVRGKKVTRLQLFRDVLLQLFGDRLVDLTLGIASNSTLTGDSVSIIRTVRRLSVLLYLSRVCDHDHNCLHQGRRKRGSNPAVRELILCWYEILLAVRAGGEYLKRWGFTPQKPLKRAYEQSPAAVGKWLNEEYPAISKRARQEGAEIHWGDETGLRSDDVRGRGYAPKGETPVLRVKHNRSSLSVISTVTNKGRTLLPPPGRKICRLALST